MTHTPLPHQTLGTLAFAGDVSMGQPVDHSPRTALLADRLGEVVRLGRDARAGTTRLALLRWAGCTANASEFAELFGDDITGRAALLADSNPFVARTAPARPLEVLIQPLASAHCEVTALLAQRLGLGADVMQAAQDLFEWWDGTGLPFGKRGDHIDIAAQLVALAGDVDALVRSQGLIRGLGAVEARAGRKYDPALVRVVRQHAAAWLHELEGVSSWSACRVLLAADTRTPSSMDLQTASELLADYVDLKVPMTAGASRRIADAVGAGAAVLGMTAGAIATWRHAALLHGLGRVSVSSSTLDKPRPLTDADWEGVRLIPHWTARTLQRLPLLADSAMIAAAAFERADGSGYPRSVAAADQPAGAGLLQAAVVWDALTSDRPWRTGMQQDQARAAIWAMVHAGTLDEQSTQALFSQPNSRPRHDAQAGEPVLTARELQVLSHVARGQSNKATARALSISPSTVGTHVESIFRKLSVTTRAAATLRAAAAGLLR